MHYVLFMPTHTHVSRELEDMFTAVIKGLNPIVKPLNNLQELKDNEIPVFFAAYTEDNRQPMAEIMASGRQYAVIDHAWFGDDTIRGKYFRIVANGFQPSRLTDAEPDWDRYRELNLPEVANWREPQGKVLFLPHSEKFGEIFRFSPYGLEVWLKYNKPFLKWEDVTIRGRHAKEAEARPSVLEALKAHRVAVGFNTEMLIRALRLGIPAIGHPQGSVVYAFNGLTPEHIDDTQRLTAKSRDEREHFCAKLATYYQASVEELSTRGFIEAMIDAQRQ